MCQIINHFNFFTQCVEYISLPISRSLTVEQYLELIRRFAEGYYKVKDEPKVKEIMKEIENYTIQLRNYGIKDNQVENVDEELQEKGRLVLVVLLRLIYIISLTPALPGIFLNLPIALVADKLAAREARLALLSSTVKIRARDVIASKKILVGLVLVPLVYLFYSLVVLIFWGPLAALFTLISLPFFSYASVIVLDECVLVGRDLNLLLKSLIISDRRKELARLRALRDDLKPKIKDLVEEFGPKVHGKEFWDNNRIVPKDEPSLPRVNSRMKLSLRPRYSSYIKESESTILPRLAEDMDGIL